jgi:hypothetical protein
MDNEKNTFPCEICGNELYYSWKRRDKIRCVWCGQLTDVPPRKRKKRHDNAEGN